MNELASTLGCELMRTTLALSAVAVATAAALRLTRITSPAAQRASCLLVLAVGWTFLRVPVAIPWSAAKPDELPRPFAFSEQRDDRSKRDALPPSIAGNEALARLDASMSASAGAAPGAAPGAVPGLEQATRVAESSTSSVASTAQDGAHSAPYWEFDRARLAAAALAAWGFGILALLAAWCAGYVRFVRCLPAGAPVDEAWQTEWRALLAARGIGRAIPLRLTADAGPMLCRLPRGYELLLPATLWRELGAGERLCILRHELAHYERGDVWKSLAVRLLALPHWFNPFAWRAVRRFDEAAEWACDRAAAGEESPTAYARALLRLGEAAGRHAAYSPAARARPLAARIRRLLGRGAADDSRGKKLLFATLAACLALAALVRVELVAQEPTAGSEPTKATADASAEGSRGKVQTAAEANSTHHIPIAGNGDASQARNNNTVGEPADPALIEAAKVGYKVALTDYDADRITLHELCSWSLRWLAAEESADRVYRTARMTENGVAPETSKEPADFNARIAANREHLERMKQLQERIEALFKVGARGGEAEKKALMNYYVTDAESRLKKLEEQTATASTRNATAAATAYNAPSFQSTPPAAVTRTALERKEKLLRDLYDEKNERLRRELENLEQVRKAVGVLDPTAAIQRTHLVTMNLQTANQLIGTLSAQLSALDLDIEKAKLELELAHDPRARDARLAEEFRNDAVLTKLVEDLGKLKEAKRSDGETAGPTIERFLKAIASLEDSINERREELAQSILKPNEALKLKELEGKLATLVKHRTNIEKQLAEQREQVKEFAVQLAAVATHSVDLDLKEQRISALKEEIDDIHRALRKVMVEKLDAPE